MANVALESRGTGVGENTQSRIKNCRLRVREISHFVAISRGISALFPGLSINNASHDDSTRYLTCLAYIPY